MNIFVRQIGGGYFEARTNSPATNAETGQRVSIVERVFGRDGEELERRLRIRFPHEKFAIARLKLRWL